MSRAVDAPHGRVPAARRVREHVVFVEPRAVRGAASAFSSALNIPVTSRAASKRNRRGLQKKEGAATRGGAKEESRRRNRERKGEGGGEKHAHVVVDGAEHEVYGYRRAQRREVVVRARDREAIAVECLSLHMRVRGQHTYSHGT